MSEKAAMFPDAGPACPVPISDYPQILMAHGGGGKLTHQLIETLFLPLFSNPALEARHDGAVVEVGNARLAFSTDSYVVRPLFFPGGNIGELAIYGTVNDLAMCGAKPQYLSAGFILEEGLPMETLQHIVQSMKAAADRAGVHLVTGDTKVVDKGKGDGIYINTAGIGLVEPGRSVGPHRITPGDVVILSGDVGRHGVAIMAAREGIAFETTIQSDCAPLNGMVEALYAAGVDVHCLRDLTRGGLATTMVELAETSGLRIELEDRAIPVQEEVRGACEILGLDPLYVANEGRFTVCVSPGDAMNAVAALRRSPEGVEAAVIGRVADKRDGKVALLSPIGTTRVVDRLSGEQLPRIC